MVALIFYLSECVLHFPYASSFGQGGEAVGEAEKLLIEDVHASVNDLVQLMQAWKSKNMISKVFTSSLCKRRQEEAEAAISDAVTRLQVRTPLCKNRLTTVIAIRRFGVLLEFILSRA